MTDSCIGCYYEYSCCRNGGCAMYYDYLGRTEEETIDAMIERERADFRIEFENYLIAWEK